MAVEKLRLKATEKEYLDMGFHKAFGALPAHYFSAPGRTEIGGNHTDHQQGKVLAAAVNLDTHAAVRINGTQTVRVLSEGYPLCSVNLDDLTFVEAERNSTAALIRGAAARISQLGYTVSGFAGTIQAFVPDDRLEHFRRGIDAVLGEGACHVLSIRPQGGVEMEVEVR